MLVTLVTILHVLVCVFLILVILLQAGKDAGMGLVGGGGGSGTVFGGRGAGSFLGKVTAACAGIFFLTSLVLSFSASYKPSVTSLIDVPPATQKSVAPAAPPAGAASSAKTNEPSDAPPTSPADHPAPAQGPAVPAPAPAK
jgi:preprotein translocase subunit SecG